MSRRGAAGRERLWNGCFVALCAATVCTALCNQLFNSALPLYADALGAPEGYIGMTGTAMTLGAALMRVGAGRLTDRFRAAPVALWGGVALLVASVPFAFLRRLEGVLLLRFVQGLGYSSMALAMGVMVAAAVPRQRLGEAVGYQGLGTPLAQSVGPALALALYNGPGFSACSWTAVGTVALALLFAAAAGWGPARSPERPPCPAPEGAADAGRGLWRVLERRTLPLAVVAFLFSVPSGVVMGFMVLFAVRLELAAPGLYFTISAVGMALTRVLAGSLADRKGACAALLPALVAGALGFGLLPFCGLAPWLYYLAGGLYGVSNGLAMPAMNAYALRTAPPGRSGTALGTYYVFMELAYASASLLGGLALQSLPFGAVFMGCAGCCVLDLPLCLLWLREQKKLPEG